MIEANESTEASNTESEETTLPAGEGAEHTPVAEKEQPIVDLVDEKFEFSVPEEAGIDKESLTGFKTFSIESKLPKETAQKVLDYLVSARSESQEAQKEANERTISDNIKAIKADPDIGGSNYATIQSAADKIPLKYGGEDFRKAVSDGGLKNDAPFLRFIRNLNLVLTEDKTITTSQTLGSSDRPVTREEEADKFFKEE